MKNLLFSILFLPCVLVGQITSASVSDSINSGLNTRISDTTLVNDADIYIQVLETFRSGSTVYVNVGNISGSQFKAISATADPQVFRYNDPTLIKAWHIYEMDTWFKGYAKNYSGFSFSGLGTRTCTVTIDGTDFTGTSTNDTDAMGMAMYHFIIDSNFPTLLN